MCPLDGLPWEKLQTTWKSNGLLWLFFLGFVPKKELKALYDGKCHLRHPASKISYHSLTLYLWAKVDPSWWKWYWLMQLCPLYFQYQNHSCWSRRCAKNWLNKVAFPFHHFGAICLDYAKCNSLTMRCHRWRIIRQWKQTDTKETWMPGREKWKEKTNGVCYFGTSGKLWQLSFAKTSIWAKSGENQDIHNT